jgi:Arc/MetJ-type ribon-helix-helix transcriptional regulator
MTTLKPCHEQLIHEALSSGRYRDADEFLDEALSAWKKGEARRYNLKTSQAAAASIRKLREGVTLGELTIKDLVAEGRR